MDDLSLVLDSAKAIKPNLQKSLSQSNEKTVIIRDEKQMKHSISLQSKATSLHDQQID